MSWTKPRLEILKVGNNKLLLVRVKPVSCMVSSPDGPLASREWMLPEHRKELQAVLYEISLQYQSSLMSDCPSSITGNREYDFKTTGNLRVCFVFKICKENNYIFLGPKSGADFTDEASSSMADKGGRFEHLVACEHTLCIAVSPFINKTTHTTDEDNINVAKLGIVDVDTFSDSSKVDKLLLKCLFPEATFHKNIQSYFSDLDSPSQVAEVEPEKKRKKKPKQNPMEGACKTYQVSPDELASKKPTYG